VRSPTTHSADEARPLDHGLVPRHEHLPCRPRRLTDAPAAGHVERVDHRAGGFELQHGVGRRRDEHVGGQLGSGPGAPPAADETGVQPRRPDVVVGQQGA
jgi:hypothetical protein